MSDRYVVVTLPPKHPGIVDGPLAVYGPFLDRVKAHAWADHTFDVRYGTYEVHRLLAKDEA